VKESSVTAPWNVEIYKINNDGHYYRICGGTLVAPNLVVSGNDYITQYNLLQYILINIFKIVCSCSLFLEKGVKKENFME